MKPFSIFNNAVRAKEIFTTLARYGFGDLLDLLKTPLDWIPAFSSERNVEELNIWERIRLIIEDLGPTFIKFGQILSSRPDLLPEQLINELRKLKQNVTPIPFEKISPILDEAFDHNLNNTFSEFNQTPIATASIGQVYKATLKSNGKTVAVKVQRPKVKKEIEADIEIISWIIKKLHQNLNVVKPYDLPGVIEEVKQGLLDELDFEIEAHHSTLFNTLNPYSEEIFAPKIEDEFSSSKVLVMEWVEGESPLEAKRTEEISKQLAATGARSILYQITKSGFFHADPHSGNILITKDNRICLLDWGLIGQLTSQMRYNLADLFVGLMKKDVQLVVNTAVRMSNNRHLINKESLEKSVLLLLQKTHSPGAPTYSIGRMGMELLYALNQNGINAIRDYVFLAKSILTIEEISRHLDPDFDIIPIGEPLLKELTWERWNPKTLAKQGFYTFTSLFRELKELPSDLQRVLRRFESEELNINLYHKGIDNFSKQLTYSINRLVLAVICASLVMGSSIIAATGVEPKVFGYPILSIVGFSIAIIIGFVISIDTLLHKNKEKAHKEKDR